jgi:hypothetical protein
MPRTTPSSLLAVVVVLAGCYHANIETGLPPGTQTLEQKWASAWVYGLVPPAVVETASRCPNGVARVETQLSFLNQVVALLTIGIYTPMTIVVTCAGPDTMDDRDADQVTIDGDADIEQKRRVIQQAAAKSLETGTAVLLRF